MRRTRIFSIIFFLISAAAFGVFHFYQKNTDDRKPPVITMESDRVTVSVEDDETAMLTGVTAADKVDGDVTDSLFVETISNFIDDKARIITICAVDESGNVAKATREVEYTDYTSPKFTLTSPLRFPLNTTDITTYLGAEDVFDGDISSDVKVTGSSTLSNAAGDYPMEFSVSNSAGDVVYLNANVTLYSPADDSKYPKIELTDYLVYTKAGQELNLRQYLKSITCHYTEYENKHDGYFHKIPQTEDDITIAVARVKVSDNIDYTTPGTYEVLYEYTDPDYTDENYTGSVRLIVIVEE